MKVARPFILIRKKKTVLGEAVLSSPRDEKGGCELKHQYLR